MDRHRNALMDLPNYGFGPVTPFSRSGMMPSGEISSSPGPISENDWLNALLTYGPMPAQMAAGIAMQPVRAGEAFGDALIDPSISNVANAGMQTALAAFRPAAALGVLGGGYAAAAAADAGLFDMGANAAPKKQRAALPIAPDALSGPQATRWQELTAKASRDNWLPPTEREELKGLNRIVETAATEKAKNEATIAREAAQRDLAEYDRAVSNAEGVLAAEKAKRPRRFEDTEVGALYNKTGIATPALMAAGVGGLSRAVTGGGNALKDYIAPGALGAMTGGVAAHWPLGHGVLFEPAANPEKAEYGAYARELPPSHPRKQEWTNYAASQPSENPTRAAIVKEFYDPVKFAERSALGVIEGLGGGLIGADAVRLPGRMLSGMRQPGGAPNSPPGPVGGAGQNAGQMQGGQPPGNARVPQYTQIPPDARRQIQDAYAFERLQSGADLPTRQTARNIRGDLQARNVNVPVTPQRVQNTNAAVNDFVMQNGRLPTSRDDWSKIWSSRTLAVPAGAAGGAAAFDEALTQYRQLVIDMDGDGIPDAPAY